MKPLLLFVRPPRPLWPFNGPGSAFWPPLAFASMAAMVRRENPDVRVEILDAPALQMGWSSLQKTLVDREPAWIGIGEEAVSCAEGLRLAALARGIGSRVIAGGCFFGHLPREVLSTGLIDVVAHGEGEQTMAEFSRVMMSADRSEWRQVRGISFLAKPLAPHPDADPGELELITTAPREPLTDLDTLPFPAYDLLPVDRYGAGSVNHPALAAIELSRGCYGSCDFCILWRQMGAFKSGRTVPHVRAKSAERLLEEIRVLKQRYGRRYLGWVDPCFNAHPRVPGELGELLARHHLEMGQSAWVRTDALVRDAASGALEALVRSGLNEVYLGIERADDAGIASLCKTSNVEAARNAVGVLRTRYPEVTVIGSFIYGLPGDTPAQVRAIHRLAMELQLDQFFFIPLTPLPGTSGWRPELWDPTGERFRAYNFLPHGDPHGPLAELEKAMILSVFLNWSPARLRAKVGNLFGGTPRRRRIHRRLQWRGARLHLEAIWRNLVGGRPLFGLIYPKWYDH
jgi:radical SAM superfamily enzyme YgiQ (UPF0313 family)